MDALSEFVDFKLKYWNIILDADINLSLILNFYVEFLYFNLNFNN